jgi:hypothetical protein
VLRELPPEGGESGRGLHLINSLAKSWGCSPTAANDRVGSSAGFRKVIWAELA